MTCLFVLFTTAPVNGGRPFAALSYMWGDVQAETPILLNGHLVAVRENLWWFLYHQRQNGRFDETFVDSLSINQNDLEERKSQVQLMGQIYRNVTVVYV